MLLHDLPLNLAKHFGNKNLLVKQFVDPRNHPNLGVQYVTEAGKLSENGFNHVPNSQEFEVVKPLGGPFFRLPLAGLVWWEPLPMGRIPARKRFMAVALNGEQFLPSYSGFAVDAPWRAVAEFSMRYKINWLGYSGVQGAPCCIFLDFREYTEFLKRPLPERKTGSIDENKVNVQPETSTT